MSISPAEWNEIKRLVERMASVILSGNTAATQVNDVVGSESIDNIVPGAATIEGRPVAHPFGMVSRAPKGTVQVTARQGDHPANRLVLLHRDKNRPSLGAEGEVMVYDAFGNQLHLKNGKIVAKLGGTMELGEGATKGVAREQDPVGANAALATFSTQVAGFINAIAPGTVSPVITAGEAIGTITSGSTKVKAVD